MLQADICLIQPWLYVMLSSDASDVNLASVFHYAASWNSNVLLIYCKGRVQSYVQDPIRWTVIIAQAKDFIT